MTLPRSELRNRELTPIPGTGVEAQAWLERRVSNLTGGRRVLAFPDSGAALCAILSRLNLSPGDQVLLSALADQKLSLAVREAGGEPVAVDVDPATFQICPWSARAALRRARESGRRCAAVVATHQFGMLCDFEPLREMADQNGSMFIEDGSGLFAARVLSGNSPENGSPLILEVSGEDSACLAFVVLPCGPVEPDLSNGRGPKADRLLQQVLEDPVRFQGLRRRLEREEQGLWFRQRAAALIAEHLSDLPAIRVPGSGSDSCFGGTAFVVRVKERDALLEFLARDGRFLLGRRPTIWTDQIVLCRVDQPVAYAMRVASEALSIPTAQEMTDDELLELCLAIRAFYEALTPGGIRAQVPLQSGKTGSRGPGSSGHMPVSPRRARLYVGRVSVAS